MTHRLRVLSVALLTCAAVLLPGGAALRAQPVTDSVSRAMRERTLLIGTKVAAPFSMKLADGSWTGISHELWRRLADSLGIRYELRELPLEALIDSTAAGRLDAIVGAVTITPERESRLDFTHPFQVSGLAIAVHTETGSGWLRVLRRFLSREFLFLILGLFTVQLVVGTLVWIFERRRNPEQFGGTVAQGLASSMWWAMVTMTTVGYGDLAPRTLGGRLVGLVWMFAALILVSSFTASITASLTLGEMTGPVSGPADLSRARVMTVEGSTSADYLTGRGISYVTLPTALDALQALDLGSTDAVVYDEPIMRYLVTQNPQWKTRVLPGSFDRQYYGIALPTYSPLREPLNRYLLEIIDSPGWKQVVAGFTGD